MPAPEYPVPLIGSQLPLVVPVSFETNGLGDVQLPSLPFRCKVVEFHSVVLEDLAASNAGTIDLKKSSTSYAQTSHAASAQVGDEQEDTTVTENTFETTDQIKLTTAKSTAGGRALVTLIIEVLPSH